MKTICTEIEINAPAEAVWNILADFTAYPAWNPFVRHIEGDLAVGKRLSIVVQPQGSTGMRFAPTVLAVAPNKELRWLGHLLLPGLFDGEHIFRLEALGPDKVHFVHEERFGGILVPMFAASLENGSRAGFVAMNEALKARAERASNDCGTA